MVSCDDETTRAAPTGEESFPLQRTTAHPPHCIELLLVISLPHRAATRPPHYCWSTESASSSPNRAAGGPKRFPPLRIKLLLTQIDLIPIGSNCWSPPCCLGRRKKGKGAKKPNVALPWLVWEMRGGERTWGIARHRKLGSRVKQPWEGRQRVMVCEAPPRRR